MPLFGTPPSRVDVTDQLGDVDVLGPPDRDLRVRDFTCPEMCREAYEAIKDDTMAQLRFKRDVVEALCATCVCLAVFPFAASAAHSRRTW